jgi:hypothetical protein
VFKKHCPSIRIPPKQKGLGYFLNKVGSCDSSTSNAFRIDSRPVPYQCLPSPLRPVRLWGPLLSRPCCLGINALKQKPKKVRIQSRTAQKTQHIITKLNTLMLLKDIISVYTGNHTKPTCGVSSLKAHTVSVAMEMTLTDICVLLSFFTGYVTLTVSAHNNQEICMYVCMYVCMYMYMYIYISL